MTPKDRPTLAEFVEWWLPRRRVRGRPLAPNTVAYYRVLLRLHILPTFGEVALADLKRVDVRAWYDALQDDRGARIAARSYRVLPTLLTSAVEEELMAASPCTLRGAAQDPADGDQIRERVVGGPRNRWAPRCRTYVVDPSTPPLAPARPAGRARP